MTVQLHHPCCIFRTSFHNTVFFTANDLPSHQHTFTRKTSRHAWKSVNYPVINTATPTTTSPLPSVFSFFSHQTYEKSSHHSPHTIKSMPAVKKNILLQWLSVIYIYIYIYIYIKPNQDVEYFVSLLCVPVQCQNYITRQINHSVQ